MSTWKCIICGTTIYSKCPGQRNEFFGPELSILKSVVTIDRVMDHRDSLSELFISYTCGADRTTASVIKDLAKSLTKKGVAEALTCDHRWVLNSKTETKCCLDHEHSNLNNVRKLRSEMKKNRKARTVQDEVQDFAYAAITPIDLARRALNISKPAFDRFIEAEFGILKQTTRESMRLLAEGKSCRPLYRVRTSGTYWKDGTYAYFDREEDAIALARGMRQKLDIEKLNTEDDAGYKSIEYELATACAVCGKPATYEEGMLVDTPDGILHMKCFKRQQLDAKVKTRYKRHVIRGKQIQCDWRRLEELTRDYSLLNIDVFASEERNLTEVYIKADMNKSDFDDTVKQLVTYVLG